MNLYLIGQSVNTSYGSYDAAVVAAETAKQAANMHPIGTELQGNRHGTWARNADDVKVTLLGTATSSIAAGVICASRRTETDF